MDRPSQPGAALEDEVLRAKLRSKLFGREPAPMKIGRFSVIKPLGSGAQGQVFSAYDDELDRKLAIKLMTPQDRDAASQREHMLIEARALARVSHPNVVQVFEVGTHEAQVYVAMEYVRGCDLRQWQSDPEVEPQTVLSMYLQAGRGLAAAHRAGLVHRDFKPDNVLVGDDGRARVVDFGLARADTLPDPAAEATSTFEARLRAKAPKVGNDTPLRAGTPAYMSPEQHRAVPGDARADQFSFCVALYEALFGVRPFAGETGLALSIAIARGEMQAPVRNEALFARLRAPMGQALSLDPGERFSTMDALLEALERCAVVSEMASASKKPRTASWVVLLVLVLGLGAAAWLLLRSVS